MNAVNYGSTGAVGSSSMMSAVEVKESQVSGQISVQDRLIVDLYEAWNMLCQRLQRVTLASAPYGKEMPPKVELVALAGDIQTNNEKLDELRAQMSDLINRLEV